MSIDSTAKINSGNKPGNIATLVLATAIAAAGMPSESYAAGRTPTHTTNLHVNQYTEHYSLEKSRAAGEKDLYALTRTAGAEEGFIFIRYNDGKEIWHEIGEEETDDKFVTNFPRSLISDPDNISELSMYHFHPDKANRITFMSETPSSYDLTANIKMMSWLNHWFPKVARNADFRIVVSTGMYTFKLDKDKLDDDRAFRQAASKISYLEQERLNMSISRSDFNYIKFNRDNFAKQNKKLAENLSNTLFKVEFRQRRAETPKAEYADMKPQASSLRKRAAGLDHKLMKMRQTVNQMKRKTHQRQRK